MSVHKSTKNIVVLLIVDGCMIYLHLDNSSVLFFMYFRFQENTISTHDEKVFNFAIAGSHCHYNDRAGYHSGEKEKAKG